MADLTITGAIAQYGRGMIQDISQKLALEFAECLQANINAGQGAGGGQGAIGGAQDKAPAPVVTARPVKGLRLGVWAFWRALLRFFRGLFGRGAS